MALPYLDAPHIAAVLTTTGAVAALERALRDGSAPGTDPLRTGVATAHGELLVMPAANARGVGAKLVSIAPDNPARGLPRIQGCYVLFNPDTLAPAALLDGVALTNLRTAAVSALAVGALADHAARTLVVFGTGPQASAHIAAMREIRPIETVRVVGRTPESAARLVSSCRSGGVSAEVADPASVAGADIVCACTTSVGPVFDGALLADDACVVAIGAHTADVRELDDTTMRRAGVVVVEARSAALAEAGDVILALRSGALRGDRIIDLAELVTGPPACPPGVRVFKSVGMAWEDLVVATEAYAGYVERGT